MICGSNRVLPNTVGGNNIRPIYCNLSALPVRECQNISLVCLSIVVAYLWHWVWRYQRRVFDS